jgi:hypothetical protein
MSSLVDRLLEIATTSLREYPGSSASKRRAVSTAYYALFHALAKTCAGELLGNSRSDSPEYERVYRALEHGSLKNAFKEKKGPLSKYPSLSAIGESVIALQSRRMKADYMPPRGNLFSRAEAEDSIELARDAAQTIARLSSDEKRVLAVHLLFKERQQ